MTYITLGILIFISIHLLPTFAIARQNIIDQFGRDSYVWLFSLLSIVGLSLIIFGKLEAPRLDIWSPPFWTILVPVVIMPLVFILLVSTYLKSNITRFIRNPMLCAVFLWSFVHLSANGDLTSIILFSSFGIFCVIDLFSTYKRKQLDSSSLAKHERPIPQLMPQLMPQESETAHIETSGRKPSSFSKLNPRQPQKTYIERYPLGRDIAAIAIGICLYLIVFYFHNTLFGISATRK